MWKYCGHLTGILGLLGVVIGGATLIGYNSLYISLLAKFMVVAPGSMSYEMWSELPMPMYMKVYYFNCTNHIDVQENGAKPLLKQLGPYVFLENHEKVNISFNADTTVDFHQIKTWFFQEDLSNGTLDDEIYTLNVIALSAAESTRWPNSLAEGDYPFLRIMMDGVFQSTEQELFLKTNIRNITFDGIESELLTMLDEAGMEEAIQMPFDKFGWFYGRNGSAEYDGLFQMWTGEGDLQKVGQITAWKNESDLSTLYPSPCSELTGSAGEFFPPNRDKTSVSYFTPDLCRTIFFNFQDETDVNGISGYKYVLDAGFVGNGTYNTSNTCYNPHPDLLQQPKNRSGADINDIHPILDLVNIGLYNGLLNASACKFNAPAYVSFPHFYLADPELMEPFHPDSDMWPNQEQHESYISLMPAPGIPLDVAIRMQINFLTRPLEYITLLQDVPTMNYPMIWFETTTVLTDDIIAQLRLLEIAPKMGHIFGGISVGVGVVLGALGLVLLRKRSSSQYTNTNQPTGEHFNLPGHELYHLKVSVLEKVWDLGRSLLEVRESKFIRDFMTELKGMNRKK